MFYMFVNGSGSGVSCKRQSLRREYPLGKFERTTSLTWLTTDHHTCKTLGLSSVELSPLTSSRASSGSPSVVTCETWSVWSNWRRMFAALTIMRPGQYHVQNHFFTLDSTRELSQVTPDVVRVPPTFLWKMRLYGQTWWEIRMCRLSLYCQRIVLSRHSMLANRW